MSCGGKWEESELLIQIQQSQRHRREGKRRWMTRSEVILKYGDQDVGNSICDSKLQDPEAKKSQVKPHPDAPQNKASNVCII